LKPLILENQYLDNIAKLVEIKVTYLKHSLSGAVPKVNLQFTIYNRSIFNLSLVRFTYTPRLLGVSGATFEPKEGCTGLSIPRQDSNFFTTFFQISEIKDKLIEWRKKAAEGIHATMTWDFGWSATFIDPKEFRISGTVSFNQEYYQI